MSNKGCIFCARCKAIRNHYFCGNTRLTEKQVFNSKGYCSNFKNKNEKGDVVEPVEDKQTCDNCGQDHKCCEPTNKEQFGFCGNWVEHQ